MEGSAGDFNSSECFLKAVLSLEVFRVIVKKSAPQQHMLCCNKFSP